MQYWWVRIATVTTGQIWGFGTFSGECMGGMAWNLATLCLFSSIWWHYYDLHVECRLGEIMQYWWVRVVTVKTMSNVIFHCKTTNWKPIAQQLHNNETSQSLHPPTPPHLTHPNPEIRTICHAWDLWKLSRSCKQLCLLSPPDLWNLPGTALLSGFQSSQGALKSTE